MHRKCKLTILSFCSTPDNLYFDSFVYVIEKVPLKREAVENIISKVLAHCTKMARSTDKSCSPNMGTYFVKCSVIRLRCHRHLLVPASFSDLFLKKCPSDIEWNNLL